VSGCGNPSRNFAANYCENFDRQKFSILCWEILTLISTSWQITFYLQHLFNANCIKSCRLSLKFFMMGSNPSPLWRPVTGMQTAFFTKYHARYISYNRWSCRTVCFFLNKPTEHIKCLINYQYSRNLAHLGKNLTLAVV